MMLGHAGAKELDKRTQSCLEFSVVFVAALHLVEVAPALDLQEASHSGCESSCREWEGNKAEIH